MPGAGRQKKAGLFGFFLRLGRRALLAGLVAGLDGFGLRLKRLGAALGRIVPAGSLVIDFAVKLLNSEQ